MVLHCQYALVAARATGRRHRPRCGRRPPVQGIGRSIGITEGISHDGFQAGLAPGERQSALKGPDRRTMTTLEFFDFTHARLPRPAPRASAGLRLRRRDPSVADGFVDGGWWPRSLDLSVELPPLLAELSRAGHDVAHVTYNPAAWN